MLARFLAGLFTADELRRWLGGDPARQAILANLPGPTAASAEFLDAVVGTMTRAGLIDGDLFERLVHDFPRRAAEIRETAVAWVDKETAAMAPQLGTTRSPSRTQGGVNIGENARVTVGGHVVGGDLTIESTGHPQSTPRRRRGPSR